MKLLQHVSVYKETIISVWEYTVQYTLTQCTVHTPHRSQYAAITLTTSCTASTYLLLTKCVIFSEILIVAPWWWLPCKPKHVGAVLLILKCFNNSAFFYVVCTSWKLKCWILLMHGVTVKLMLMRCSWYMIYSIFQNTPSLNRSSQPTDCPELVEICYTHYY